MSGWLSIRRAPEGLKQRLRPLLVKGVAGLRRLPGGRAGIALLRRLAPGAHAWLKRRHAYYVDAGLGRAALVEAGVAAGDLDAEAQRVLGWLLPADRG